MVRILQTLGAWLALASSAGLVLADEKAETRARNDYLLHCSGCHGQDGMGKPGKGIPRFEGQIGYFQRLPDGRAFVMQVPGLLSANLPDDRAAAVTTWMIRRFAGDSLPPDFQPYSAEEARRYRTTRPADIMGRRNELYARLLALGYAVE
jgi:hypothetical protein